MAEAILAQGVACIQQAVTYDNAGNLREALRHYNLGLESFMNALKYEKNDRVKSTLMPKIHDYMTRAEQIKKALSSGTPSSTSPPPTPNVPMLFPNHSSSFSSSKPSKSSQPRPTSPPSSNLNFTPFPPTQSQTPQQNLHAETIKIKQGQLGCSYDSLFGRFLVGASVITVEDPYIRTNHQITNFLRLCELIIKRTGGDCLVHLMTSSESPEQKQEIETKIGELKASMANNKLQLVLTFNEAMHDREIKLNNGWIIKIGRGLDIYTKPLSKFSIGYCDMDLRPCLETTIDIFKNSGE